MKKILLFLILCFSFLGLGRAQWQDANNGLFGGIITQLAVDQETNYVYAATGNGIFRSDDNCNSWISVNAGRSSSIAINGTNIFASIDGGIYLSTDNGSTWIPKNNNLYANCITISGTNLYAGTWNGILLSTDNGSTWSEINNGLSGLGLFVFSIAVKGSNVFAGTWNGVYLSTDNGNNWATVNNGISGNGLYVSSLSVSGDDIFVGTEVGVFLSDNNGLNWNAMTNGLTNSVNSLALRGSDIYAGAYGGVFVSSNNGASWIPLNIGLTNASVHSIALNANNLYAGTEDGVFLSTNNGSSWNKVSNGIRNLWTYSFVQNGSNLFVAGQKGIFLSTDDGNNWNEMNNGLPNTFFTSLVISGNNIFTGTYSGVYLSQNNGSSWTAKNNGLTNKGVTCLAISGTNLFAGTEGDGVYLSNDNGNSWTQVKTGLTNYGIYVHKVVINGSNIFAATNSGVFLSTDNGNHWIERNAGLTDTYIWSLAVTGSNVYAATQSGGVCLSTDNGMTWNPINNGLLYPNVMSLIISGSNILAGTNGGGVYLSLNNGSLWTAVNSGLTGMRQYVCDMTIDGNNIFAATSGGVWKRPINEFNFSNSHFVPVWWPGNGMDHMNLYALSATLDNIDLQPGDEIGIFDGNVCVGMGVLTQVLGGPVYLSMVASKDDPDTPEKDGYTTGNIVTYRVWDSSAGSEVSNVQAEYVSGTGIFAVGATSMFNLNALTSITHDISLSTGWNIMSFAAEPDNMSLMSIVTTLKNAGTLVKIQDEKGNAIEQLPAPIGWVDNIGLMKISEGYKIKVSANTTLSTTGKPVTLPNTITLETGWNIMGYPSMTSQPALAAYQSLIDAGTLLKVQDEKGNAIEKLPAPIGWIDNIHNLLPGEGYKIKTNAGTTLTINNSGKGENQFTETAIIRPAHFKPVYKGNGLDQMNIYVQSPTFDGVALKAGDEIGVFDGKKCVGAVVVDDPTLSHYTIISSLDDPTTTEADGFTEGNAFDLRLWDAQTGSEGKVQRAVYQKGYTNHFEKLGTSVLTADFTKESINVLGDAFPNPSSDKTTFTFQLAGESKVRLEIYNIKGDLVKILLDRQMPGGTHRLEWDNKLANGTSASSGMYFYRLKLNNFLQTKQLVVN